MTIIAKLTSSNNRSQASRSKPAKNAYRAIAEAAGSLRQYQDIPTRFQGDWAKVFLLGMVVIVLVAGSYLKVTSSAAIVGREIQGLEARITANEQINSDLQIQIASQLANNSLEARATALGFAPLQGSDLDYMVVPGYFPPKAVNMVSTVPEADMIAMSPEFTESLFDWIGRQMEAASSPLAQVTH